MSRPARSGPPAVPWPHFERAAAELAERGGAMLRGFTLGYLATLRPDGSPRLHPVTVTVHETGLYMYAVASTPKGRDLHRDPRYAFRLDVSWALHKRRERDRGPVYLRWRLESRPRQADRRSA